MMFYPQRLSVYVQLSDGKPGQVIDDSIPNPYNEEAYKEYQRLKKAVRERRCQREP